MRKILLAAALTFSAGVCVLGGCTKSEADKADKGPTADVKIPSATVADLDQWLTAKQAQAVDCNTPNTRKREGVVPGAILISDEEQFAATELPADKQAKLVFYCGGPG